MPEVSSIAASLSTTKILRQASTRVLVLTQSCSSLSSKYVATLHPVTHELVHPSSKAPVRLLVRDCREAPIQPPIRCVQTQQQSEPTASDTDPSASHSLTGDQPLRPIHTAKSKSHETHITEEQHQLPTLLTQRGPQRRTAIPRPPNRLLCCLVINPRPRAKVTFPVQARHRTRAR
ncbi:hypothetical protein SODALDRAFT_358201 [Sodiomyces alkalinus F11]|uniref:Uncharacterized protein n=1 Tax=Sodiomyces alkalinus (strain CBS 110278 / VKM F-3762 / F11) TaxID=1314773 RepID=A0A3N2PZ27_SODAK|nr:hypothetical protein SODALDRAFT_358201 [Sodiomyces alkalinus F11]ROT39783.1 hypothetical protein SODALDRAFT_358201 [Sodiomyces alkalinus F11]